MNDPLMKQIADRMWEIRARCPVQGPEYVYSCLNAGLVVVWWKTKPTKENNNPGILAIADSNCLTREGWDKLMSDIQNQIKIHTNQ